MAVKPVLTKPCDSISLQGPLARVGLGARDAGGHLTHRHEPTRQLKHDREYRMAIGSVAERLARQYGCEFSVGHQQRTGQHGDGKLHDVSG